MVLEDWQQAVSWAGQVPTYLVISVLSKWEKKMLWNCILLSWWQAQWLLCTGIDTSCWQYGTVGEYFQSSMRRSGCTRDCLTPIYVEGPYMLMLCSCQARYSCDVFCWCVEHQLFLCFEHLIWATVYLSKCARWDICEKRLHDAE